MDANTVNANSLFYLKMPTYKANGNSVFRYINDLNFIEIIIVSIL